MTQLCEAACLTRTRQRCRGKRLCAVRAAVKGNQEARELVFSRLSPIVLSHARVLCGGGREAEDLAQAALLKAFERIGQLRDRKRLLGWTRTVVRTTYLMSLRHSRFAPPGHLEASLEEEPPAPRESRLGEQLDARQAVDRVLAGVAALPEGLRRVIGLRVFQDLSTEQTARLLGISPAAVRTRLKRARQALHRAVDGVRSTP